MVNALLGERLGVVVELGEVDIGDCAPAFAAWAHAAGDAEAATLLHGSSGALYGDRTRSTDRGDVEGERLRRADVRLPESAEEDAQHRAGVGGGTDGGAGVGTHPLLVDGDHGRQPFEHVDLGPRLRRHEALYEGTVGLVDQPLRLRGDGAEHQRALTRAGDAGEHRQPALGDLDADVLEVVHARAVHADQIVAVGSVRCRRLRFRPRGRGHRVSICCAGRVGGLRRRGLARSNQASISAFGCPSSARPVGPTGGRHASARGRAPRRPRAKPRCGARACGISGTGLAPVCATRHRPPMPTSVGWRTLGGCTASGPRERVWHSSVVQQPGDVSLGAGLMPGLLDGADCAGDGCDRRMAQRSSWMRTRLPAGSRTAQSRTPYGCSVGS